MNTFKNMISNTVYKSKIVLSDEVRGAVKADGMATGSKGEELHSVFQAYGTLSFQTGQSFGWRCVGIFVLQEELQQVDDSHPIPRITSSSDFNLTLQSVAAKNAL